MDGLKDIGRWVMIYHEKECDATIFIRRFVMLYLLVAVVVVLVVVVMVLLLLVVIVLEVLWCVVSMMAR